MINDLWYKNAVIYCLSVATYMDANGDGSGDFQGLMRRLDYLQGLGVTAIWLMPFQPSPCKDDGYDVADYYGVNPRYGTLGDFVEFTQMSRESGSHKVCSFRDSTAPPLAVAGAAFQSSRANSGSSDQPPQPVPRSKMSQLRRQGAPDLSL
jgi:hypothetical protein